MFSIHLDSSNPINFHIYTHQFQVFFAVWILLESWIFCWLFEIKRMSGKTGKRCEDVMSQVFYTIRHLQTFADIFKSNYKRNKNNRLFFRFGRFIKISYLFVLYIHFGWLYTHAWLLIIKSTSSQRSWNREFNNFEKFGIFSLRNASFGFQQANTAGNTLQIINFIFIV